MKMRGPLCSLLLPYGQTEDRFQSLRGYTTRVREVDFTVPAVSFQPLGGGEVFHDGDGFLLSVVGPNVQHLYAGPLGYRFEFDFFDFGLFSFSLLSISLTSMCVVRAAVSYKKKSSTRHTQYPQLAAHNLNHKFRGATLCSFTTAG